MSIVYPDVRPAGPAAATRRADGRRTDLRRAAILIAGLASGGLSAFLIA